VKTLRRAKYLLVAAIVAATAVRVVSQDIIGVALLSTVTTNVNGAGVRVAQPEAGYDQADDYTNWEVNPGAVGQPGGHFTYVSANGSTTNFPNSLSSESAHADAVGGIFYGMPGGVATNVAHVDNYDANDLIQVGEFVTPFSTNYTASLPAANINDAVVNQSFTFGVVPTNEQEAIDSAYDNYAARYNTLFVSAANNGGPVSAPGTSYNCISVGAYGGGSSYGPTLDNGRAKPDITAPAGETSFSTPLVSGAAAVLIQAGLRGDGGSDTNSPGDIRMVKALLLNGAIKPADWTNNPPSPLDTRYGVGVLNVFNSYKQLAGGKHGYIFSTNVPTSTGHPPTGATGTVGALSGWDFNTNTSSSTSDGVNHYYFNVTNGSGSAAFNATATLVWNRQRFQKGINNLDIFLYAAVSSNLVVCSTSLVDNVEHIFVPRLAQGRYDLQVWKAGGAGTVSVAEPYALAWEFFSTSLNASKSGTNISISWPIYPAGFVLQAATNLVTPVAWDANNPAPEVTNNQNVVLLNATNADQFFRLWRP
jgi:hypothetical protein